MNGRYRFPGSACSNDQHILVEFRHFGWRLICKCRCLWRPDDQILGMRFYSLHLFFYYNILKAMSDIYQKLDEQTKKKRKQFLFSHDVMKDQLNTSRKAYRQVYENPFAKYRTLFAPRAPVEQASTARGARNFVPKKVRLREE